MRITTTFATRIQLKCRIFKRNFFCSPSSRASANPSLTVAVPTGLAPGLRSSREGSPVQIYLATGFTIPETLPDPELATWPAQPLSSAMGYGQASRSHRQRYNNYRAITPFVPPLLSQAQTDNGRWVPSSSVTAGAQKALCVRYMRTIFQIFQLGLLFQRSVP